MADVNMDSDTVTPTISLLLDLQPSQQRLIGDAVKDVVCEYDFNKLLRVDSHATTSSSNKQVNRLFPVQICVSHVKFM